MNEKEINKDNSSFLNLIAIGAFLWYFLKSFAYLFFISYKSIGIISGIDPKVLFWTSQILQIIMMCLVLRILITKIWKQIEFKLINIKKLLIKIGMAILFVQILQFLHGLYVSEYLSSNFESAMIAFKDTVNTIDKFYLIDSIFDIVGTLTLLLLFIKWK